MHKCSNKFHSYNSYSPISTGKTINLRAKNFCCRKKRHQFEWVKYLTVVLVRFTFYGAYKIQQTCLEYKFIMRKNEETDVDNRFFNTYFIHMRNNNVLIILPAACHPCLVVCGVNLGKNNLLDYDVVEQTK